MNVLIQFPDVAFLFIKLVLYFPMISSRISSIVTMLLVLQIHQLQQQNEFVYFDLEQVFDQFSFRNKKGCRK
jgi:hypothetical protein